MDQTILQRYQQGPALLRASVAGLTQADLDAFPIPNTWSIRQIVVHLLDSDMAATHRIRRMLAEDTPLLIAYDETAFSHKLDYHSTDVELALRLFEDNRRFTMGTLKTLTDAAYARTGVHNQRGKVTVADMVRLYADHVHHHHAFIIKKRALLGKPLKA